MMTSNKNNKNNKNKKEMSPERRLRLCSMAGAVGIVTNLALAACKLFVGMASGSVSVTADAANNLTDCAGSVVTLVGFRLAGKPADREHPFGHARFEYLTGLCISAFVLMLGANFLKDSIKALVKGAESTFSTTALILLGISVAVKIAQGLFYRAIGKMTHSTSLAASASDSIGDSIMTATVLVGALIKSIFDIEVDAPIGIAVAAFILISGIKLVKDAAGTLLGRAPERETVDKLCEKILSYDGVLGIHDLIVHSYGEGKIFASAHVEVDRRVDVMISHELIDKIEHDVAREQGIGLVIHLDPISVDDPLTNELRDITETAIGELSDKLRFHDFRIVEGKSRTNLIFDLVVPTDFPTPDDDILTALGEKIREKYPTAVLVVDIDRDYSNMF